MFFCDRCKKLIAIQRLAYRFDEEKWLYPVGEREWCRDCLDNLDRELVNSPDINDPAYKNNKK